jgi:hypothetical protein
VAGFNITVAAVSVPGCLVFFHRTGPFAWNGLGAWWIPLAAFGLWMIIMTIYLLRAIDRPVEPDNAEQQIERVVSEIAALRKEFDRR